MYFCLPVPVTISKGEYVAIVLVFPFLLFFHKLPMKTCNTLILSMVRALLKTQQILISDKTTSCSQEYVMTSPAIRQG